MTDVYNALQTFLGGLYVNDFNRFGRTWRVMMQAEPEFRDQPDDINRFYVRTVERRHGAAEHAGRRSKPMTGPEVIYRYNRFRTAKIIGQTAPGYSSGQAAAAMEQIARAEPADRLRLRMDGHGVSAEACRKARKDSSSASPAFWCSCFWRRCTRAGRFRSRWCWRFRSDCSAPCWRFACARTPTTSTRRSAS